MQQEKVEDDGAFIENETTLEKEYDRAKRSMSEKEFEGGSDNSKGRSNTSFLMIHYQLMHRCVCSMLLGNIVFLLNLK